MPRAHYKGITFPDIVADKILSNPKSLTELLEDRWDKMQSLKVLTKKIKKTPKTVRVYV